MPRARIQRDNSDERADDDTIDSDEWRGPITPTGTPPATTADSESDSFKARVRLLAARDGIDRVNVKLYRRQRNTATLEWCADYSVAEFDAGDLSLIREDWGPGDYQLRVIGPEGLMMRENVSIARQPEKAQINASQGIAGELAPILAQMIENQNRLENRIASIIENRPDPTAQLQQTLALMASMRDAMGINNAPPPPPPSDPSAMLGQIVGAIRQLREVSDEISPKKDAPDTDNPMALLPPVLDLVKTAMENRGPAMAPAIAIPPSVATASQDSAPEPQQQPQTEENMNPLGLLVLKGQLQKLLSLADAKKSPEEGGEFIAEHLPDEMLPYLDLPNWLEIVCSFEPRCGHDAYKSWLEKAKNHAIELLSEGGSEGGPTDVA